MSNDKPTVVTTVPSTDAPASAELEVSKQPNAIVRGFHAIKNNPKTTFAVVAGTCLVAGSAFLGRKTAPLHIEIVESDIELEPLVINQASNDTETA